MSIKVKQTQYGVKKYFGLKIYDKNNKSKNCHINIDDDFNATLHCSSKTVLSSYDIDCIKNAMSSMIISRKFERETNKKLDPNGTPNTRGGSSSLTVHPLYSHLIKK